MEKRCRKVKFFMLCMILSLMIVLVSHGVVLVPARLLVKSTVDEWLKEEQIELEINGISTTWKKDGLYLGSLKKEDLKLVDFSLLKSIPSLINSEKIFSNLEEMNFEKVGFTSLIFNEKKQKYWKVRVRDKENQLNIELLFTLRGILRNLYWKQGEIEYDIWKKEK